MMNNKKLIALALAFVLLFNAGLIFFMTKPAVEHFSTGAAFELPAQNFWVAQTATSGLVALTATEQRIVATSTARKWIYVTAGQGCSQGFYVSMANDAPATTLNSHFVASSSAFDISPQLRSYTGSVRALSNGGTCNINVTGY